MPCKETRKCIYKKRKLKVSKNKMMMYGDKGVSVCDLVRLGEAGDGSGAQICF